MFSLVCSHFLSITKSLALVVRNVDNAIQRINRYQADNVVCFVNTYIYWIVIYPVDSVIQPLNNRGQETTEDVLTGKLSRMAAMENILQEVFVCRFLMEENNSYEDLLVVIKNRYPNLRVCSL